RLNELAGVHLLLGRFLGRFLLGRLALFLRLGPSGLVVLHLLDASFKSLAPLKLRIELVLLLLTRSFEALAQLLFGVGSATLRRRGLLAGLDDGNRRLRRRLLGGIASLLPALLEPSGRRGRSRSSAHYRQNAAVRELPEPL